MNQYSSAFRGAALASSLIVASVVGCSAGTITQIAPGDTSANDGGPSGDDKDAGSTTATMQMDDAATAKPDAAEAVPTSAFFDVTVNGKAVTVKNVAVDHHNVYPDQGISYYEITATLAQTPPIVDGLDEDPTIVISVGKDESGSDACKEERGPQVGFVQPVTALREVQIHYQRFTGSQTVSAYLSTKTSGSCTMLLKSTAANGQAWGQATGMVKGSGNEPALAFEAKWFQALTWK